MHRDKYSIRAVPTDAGRYLWVLTLPTIGGVPWLIDGRGALVADRFEDCVYLMDRCIQAVWVCGRYQVSGAGRTNV
jgi:hypothetical protein